MAIRTLVRATTEMTALGIVAVGFASAGAMVLLRLRQLHSD
jgi:hypothetical protein